MLQYAAPEVYAKRRATRTTATSDENYGDERRVRGDLVKSDV
jgi:hypothetical protein